MNPPPPNQSVVAAPLTVGLVDLTGDCNFRNAPAAASAAAANASRPRLAIDGFRVEGEQGTLNSERTSTGDAMVRYSAKDLIRFPDD